MKKKMNLKLFLILVLVFSFNAISQEKKVPASIASTLEPNGPEVELIDNDVNTEEFIKKYFADYEVKSVLFNGKTYNILSLKKRGTFRLTEQYYCADTGEPIIPSLNFGDVASFGSIIALNTVTAKIYLDSNHTPTSDKLLHFTTGYNIGSFGTGLAQLILPKKMKKRRLVAFLSGAGLAILAGIAKEVKDSDGSGNVELLDALATSAGGVAGAATFSFTDLKRVFSKNKRKKLKKDAHEVSDLERLLMEIENREQAQSAIPIK